MSKTRNFLQKKFNKEMSKKSTFSLHHPTSVQYAVIFFYSHTFKEKAKFKIHCLSFEQKTPFFSALVSYDVIRIYVCAGGGWSSIKEYTSVNPATVTRKLDILLKNAYFLLFFFPPPFFFEVSNSELKLINQILPF